jgi:predicted ester cyclase
VIRRGNYPVPERRRIAHQSGVRRRVRHRRGGPDRHLVTDDFVCHHAAAGVETHGADGHTERIRELRESFSDFEMNEESLADGDTGAGHYRWGGTHDGEFVGIPVTDRTVDTTIATLMRVDGDRTAESGPTGTTAK